MTDRRFLVVTSFHRKQAEWGMRMAGSWGNNWPAPFNCELIIYAEDCLVGHPDGLQCDLPWIKVVDLHECCPELVAFKEKHRDNPQAHGLGWDGKVKWPSQPSPKGPYHYRLDAVKFANKTFAVIHAATNFLEEFDVLIWMDADTLTHRKVPEEYLETLLPKGYQVAWLERQGVYPECGFYLLDLKSPVLHLALKRWARLYITGDLFKDLTEWHDSFVFSWIIKQYEAINLLKVHSLSGKGAKTNHPLANGPLGAYFDHLKGKWKTLPRSPKGAVGHRPERHWQQ